MLPVVHFDDVSTYTPPDIDGSPTSLTFSVPARGTQSQQLSISNFGSEDLIWNVSESNWPGSSPQLDVSVYNVLGQKVGTRVHARKKAGRHLVRWDGRNDLGGYVSSGIYLLRFKAETYLAARRMTLLR